MGSLMGIADRLGAFDSPLGVALLLAIPAVGALFALFRNWASWRERSFSMSRKREKDFMEIVRRDKPLERVSPIQLERAFRKCMGYEMSSVELRFALQRDNTSRLLRAMRNGRNLVRRDGEQFFQKGILPLWLLDSSATLLGVTAGIGCVGCIVGALIGHAPALTLIATELAVIVWMCIEGMRGAAAARFLLEPANFPRAPAADVDVDEDGRKKGSRKKSGRAKAGKDGALIPVPPSTVPPLSLVPPENVMTVEAPGKEGTSH